MLNYIYILVLIGHLKMHNLSSFLFQLNESDGSGEQDESTELPDGQEPDFPHADLARLDEMINRPRWVVHVLPNGELEILLDAAINLSKQGNVYSLVFIRDGQNIRKISDIRHIRLIFQYPKYRRISVTKHWISG